MATAEDDLALLKAAGQAAGKLAMTFFRQSPNVRAKVGGSPVTEADTAVDAFLHATLMAERPDYGWLSEESVDDLSRRARNMVFVIDPIDGTRGFIEGDDRWCVSLAVVRAGRPVSAVLYAPARDEFFSAAAGKGAWVDRLQLSVSGTARLVDARLAGPRGWLKSDAVSASGARLHEHVPSLAYRFAEVATGRVDAAFASPRANDWDLAACDLLVHEAGGRLTGLDGAAPVYNGEIPRHGVLAAANPVLQPELLAVVREAEREIARSRRPAPPRDPR